MSSNPDPSEVTIIYDTQCPVCTAYSCAVEVGEDKARPRLISARSNDSEVSAAVAAGLDLDDGMVVIHKGQRHHGAEAMHFLALAAPRKGVLPGINRVLFGSLAVARVLYPVLRCGRALLLLLLGRKKIRAGRQESR